MKTSFLVLAACLLAGCASTAPAPQTPAAAPDSRELSEHPLDVMGLPQP